ncbi:F-box/LRR-repeat protein 6 [Syngnathus typhle]|uniref:F-box/LRR-repeat protein 6 n=1 Tax=Syngnathus typhle TaxID=161592 RepID=UPI002A6AA178|nr:F-box/LRR-repeat protein 6 [Syngnathus typhle]
MMASAEGAVEDVVASLSTQENQEPNPTNASQKRNTTKLKKEKVKKKRTNVKKKRTNVKRMEQPRYTVHEGEDMLLVISSTTSPDRSTTWVPKIKRKKGGEKKNVEKEETPPVIAAKPHDRRWGQNLPEEVLVNIFKMVVNEDGAVPFLCRVGRVCRLWNIAAATPILWRKVSVGHCWIAPGEHQNPERRRRIKNTFDWLTRSRFSQLRDFSLHHWTENVDYAVDVVSQFCSHLSSLTLSYCTGLTEAAFQSLGLHGHSLRSLNLQYTKFQEAGLLTYLNDHGAQIQQIRFTHRPKCDRLSFISRGCCPNLEMLEVNTKLDSQDNEVTVCIQALQRACPKLKTFRMLNVCPVFKNTNSSNGAESSPGFPLLEELCIATASYTYINDKQLRDVLFGSPRLRVLDLRGCSRITSAGLEALPCLELECLFWAQYFSSHMGTLSLNTGLHALTQKWSHTLRQLDVANQPFSQEDVEAAMFHLAQANHTDTLRSLNLSGTKITAGALRLLIGQTSALDYLNLSSCRDLPRGVKRIYRGQAEIRQLLEKLECSQTSVFDHNPFEK